MIMLDQWEQSAVFSPSDPTQKKIEKYAGIPGAYASFYFNKTPVTNTLKGPFTSGISTGAGLALGLLLGSILIGGGRWALHKTGVIKKPSGISGFSLKKLRRSLKRKRR